MAKIKPELLAAIRKKTGLSQPQVYARIGQTARTNFLERHLAAIKLAAEVGLTINKYAKPAELAQLRQAGSPVAAPEAVISSAAPIAAGKAKGMSKNAKKTGKATPNKVFVVHGRDKAAKDAMFAFIRSLGVVPIEWNAAIAMSEKSAPYVGEILDAAFAKARAVVVLLTPDDLAQLRPDLVLPSDPPYERRQMGQARPNVLFECGMAFSSHPDRTVIVQLGNIRPFSDTVGRHAVHMSNEFAKRQELAIKLRNAGCDIEMDGSDWVRAGDFTDPDSRVPATRK
jgi:predicted nucleotide-binding protein